MITLAKWASRAYLTTHLLKAAGHAKHRTFGENTQALINRVHDTKESIMSLADSPGASLHPDRQQRRNTARQQVPVVRAATTALLGTAGTDALRVGNHTLRENETGALVAVGPDGTETPLTAAITPEPEGGENTSDAAGTGTEPVFPSHDNTPGDTTL